MPSLEVPSWLQPMSETDRAHLALAEDQVKQKGVSMLRKQIGLSRMQDQASKLISSGVDEATARKTALLDNAEFIFTDEPHALVNLQNSDNADVIKKRAADQLDQRASDLQDYRNHLLGVRSEHDKAMADFQTSKLNETSSHNVASEQIRQDALNEKSAHNVETEAAANLRIQAAQEGVIPKQMDFEGRKFLVNPKSGVLTPIDASGVTPSVVDFDGKKFLVNPKSGAIHPLAGNLSPADNVKLRFLYGELKRVNKDFSVSQDPELGLEKRKIEKSIAKLAGEVPPARSLPTAAPADPVSVSDPVPVVTDSPSPSVSAPAPAPAAPGKKRYKWTPQGLIPIQ